MLESRTRHFRITIAVLTCLAGLASTYIFASAVPIRPGAYKWPVGEMGAAQIAISGKQPGDGFGDTIATGDLNGDGFSDLLVSAPFLSDELSSYSEVYIIPGPLPIGEVITVPQRTAITFWYRQQDKNQIGRLLDSGDFNGDGYDDVVLSLWPAGITIVYPGNAEIKAENPQTITPFGTEMALTVKEASGGITVCNINGDEFDDLIVEDGTSGLTLRRLHVWGILGSASITFTNPMTIDLQSKGANILIVGQDLVGWGEPTNRNIGCGDIDGDGVEDLVFGAYMESPEGRDAAGTVYIIQGSTSITAAQPITMQMPLGAGAVIQGVDTFEFEGDRLGQSLAVGDTNGDGREDLVLGAPGGFGPDNTISHTGEIYLWLGRDLEGQIFDISSQARWRLHGMYTFTGLGGSGLHTDDLDNDGMEEVLIGCMFCDEQLLYPYRSGRGLVIENNLPGGWRPAGGSASFYAYFNNSMYDFGLSADSGDFDADGYPDMVFGAPNYGYGSPNVPSRVYIIPYPIRFKLYFPSIASTQQ